MSLSSGAVIADPFRRTADAVDLLRLRAAQIAEREQAVTARRSRTELKRAALA